MSGNAAVGAAQCYRVTEWRGSLDGVEIASHVTAITSTPNPPEVTAPWGNAKNLFFASSLANDGDESLVSSPTNYTGGVATFAGAGLPSAAVYTARRELTASSDNPGSFQLGFSDACRTTTIVIRPIATIPLAAGSGIIAAGL
jgi:hypothetical protein